MKNKNKYFYDIVKRVSEQSDCRSRRVGSIAVREGTVICEGWNNPPTKCHPFECIRCNKKENGQNIESGTSLEESLCAHSEANLISAMTNFGINAKGADLYCTNKPCSECAKSIVRAGFSNVYYFEEYASLYTDLIFDRANVNFQKIEVVDEF